MRSKPFLNAGLVLILILSASAALLLPGVPQVAASPAPAPSQHRAAPEADRGCSETLGGMSVDDNASFYAPTASGEIVDCSNWPNVTVKVTNNQSFWLSLDPTSFSAAGVEILSRDLLWAPVGLLPPGASATYTVRFLDDRPSSFVVFFDGSGHANTPGGSSVSAWMLTLIVAALELVGVVAPYDAQNLIEYTDGLFSLVDLFESVSQCGDGLSDAVASHDAWGVATEYWGCIADPTIQDGIVEVVNGLGYTISREILRTILLPIKVFSMAFDIGKTFTAATLGIQTGHIIFRSTLDTSGTAEIQYRTSTGDSITGACFAFFVATESGERIGMVPRAFSCDNRNGADDGMTTLDVAPGEYVLAQARTPNGYFPAEDQVVTVPETGSLQLMVTARRAGDLTVSVVDDSNESLAGACFRISLNGSVGGPAASCDEDDGVADGMVHFAALEAGEYTLTQSVAPLDHAAADDRTIQIPRDQPTQVEVVNTKNLNGSLVVHLTGDDGALPLGSCFDLLKYSQSAQTLAARVCDELNGVFHLNTVPKGDYVLTQTTTPDGYLPAPDTYFAIFGGRETALTVINHFPGNLSIENIDAEGAPVSGSCFLLTSSNSARFTRCDDNGDGEIIVSGLSPVAYTITQTTWPAAYLPADPKTVTIQSLQTTPAQIVNHTGASLDVSALGSDGQLAPGACYYLYLDSGGGVRSQLMASGCDESDGSNDGKTTISLLQPGNYVLAEQTTPPRQVPAADQPISLTTDQQLELTITHQLGAKLKITSPGLNGVNQVGACYAVFIDAGEGMRGQLVRQDCDGHWEWVQFVDTTGVVIIENIPPGSYILGQTGAVEQHFIAEDQAITVAAGDIVDLTVPSKPWPTLTVNAVDQNGTTAVGGCYSLNLPYYVRIQPSGCDESDGVLDGVTHIALVDPKTYTLEETQTPVDQATMAPQTVTVTREGPNELTLTYQTAGSIRISAVDADGSTVLGACYQLYDQTATLAGEGCDGHWEWGQLFGATGIVQVDHLAPGIYSLRSSGAANHFAPADQNVTIAANQVLEVTAEFSAYPTLIVHLKDGSGNPVLGACFYYGRVSWDLDGGSCDELDGSLDGTTTVRNVYPGDYVLIARNIPAKMALPADRAISIARGQSLEVDIVGEAGGSVHVVATDANGALLGRVCYAVMFASDPTTPALPNTPCGDNGQLTIGNLAPGSYLLRISSTTGPYLFQDKPFTIEAGVAAELPVSYEFYPNVTIDVQTQTGEALPGACFTLSTSYYPYSGGAGCDIDDGSNDGHITIKLVAPGTYTLRESKTPLGYANAPAALVSVQANEENRLSVQHLTGGALHVSHWSGTGTLLFGACGQVYIYDDGDRGALAGDQICDGSWSWGTLYGADGTVDFDGLLPGEYLYVETRAPLGHDLAPDTQFSITGGQDTNTAIFSVGVQPINTPNPTATVTPTPSLTGTSTSTETATATQTATPPGTGMLTTSPSPSPSVTSTPSTTPTAPPTLTNTPTLTGTPTSTPAIMVRTTTRVNLREGPGTNFGVIAVVPSGSEGVVTGASTIAGGYTWYPVTFVGLGSGYMADRYFDQVEPPILTPVPPTNTATRTSTVTSTPSNTRTPSITATITPTQPATSTPVAQVRTTTRVNLRQGPGTNYPVVVVVPSGTIGVITGASTIAGRYTWYPVTFAGLGSGYMAGNYFSQLEPVPLTPTPTRTPTTGPIATNVPGTLPIGSSVKTTTRVNLRKGPGTSFGSNGVVASGALGTITGPPTITGRFTWYPVTFAGYGAGYMAGEYLDQVGVAILTPTRTPTAVPIATNVPGALPIGSSVKTTVRVNLREGPGTGFSASTVVAAGTLGTITGPPTVAGRYTWYPVTFAGYGAGYMADEYLDQTASVSSSDQSASTITSTPMALATETAMPIGDRTESGTPAASEPTGSAEPTSTPTPTEPPTATPTETATWIPEPTWTLEPTWTSESSVQSPSFEPGQVVEMNTDVNMRSGPDTSFDVLALLPAGTTATVVEVDDPEVLLWIHVQLEDDSDGWISVDFVQLP